MKNSYWVLLSVLILATFLAIFTASTFSKLQKKEIRNHHVSSRYLTDMSNHKFSAVDCAELFSDSTILLFGSSELGFYNTLMPFNFLPDNFGKRLLAIGKAGTQTFADFSVLTSYKKYLKTKQIVILISPNWFCGKSALGTHPELFMNYFNPAFYDTAIIKSEFSEYLTDYYLRNELDLDDQFILRKKLLPLSDISATKIIHNEIMSLGESIKDMLCSNNNLVGKNIIDDDITSKTKEVENYSSFFDTLRVVESKDFLSTCTNNNYGIYDDYYTKYCEGKLPFSLIPTQVSENQELKDLKTLLHFLKTEKYKPLVVLLPVNPYAYDMKDFLPFKQHIENEIKKYNFPFLNLFVNDTTTYQKGMCRDAMHTGPLGWIEINKKIVETFYPNEYGN